MSVSNLIFNTPIMVHPAKLAVFLGAAGDRLLPGNVIPHETLQELERQAPGWMRQSRRDRNQQIEALVPGYPVIMTDAENLAIRVNGKSIGIINVFGSLTQRASLFASGGTSYDSIGAEFHSLVNDPDISAIVLQVDSPGGVVAGNFDLAEDIRKASRETSKRVWALANEAAYSAAYSIASAAERLIVTRTATVGSIGVIAIHVDQSSFNEKLGVKITPIFAGARKNDYSPHAPLSDRAYKSLQSEVNRLYDIFTSTVARNRGMSQMAVRGTEAGTYMGQDAVEMGLADDVASFNETLEEIASRGTRSMPRFGTRNMTTTKTQETKNMEHRLITATTAENIEHDLVADARRRALEAGQHIEHAVNAGENPLVADARRRAKAVNQGTPEEVKAEENPLVADAKRKLQAWEQRHPAIR